MENKNLVAEKSKSEAEEIIIRINDRINDLFDKLRPIYLDNADTQILDEKVSSLLIKELIKTENKITQLLEGIRI